MKTKEEFEAAIQEQLKKRGQIADEANQLIGGCNALVAYFQEEIAKLEKPAEDHATAPAEEAREQ